MQEKIEKFKKMSIKEQKKILLIIMEKSIDKSQGIQSLYNQVSLIYDNEERQVVKDEFIKIYTFLMEAVNYINSTELKKSFNRLDIINKKMMELRKKENDENNFEDLDDLLERELLKI